MSTEVTITRKIKCRWKLRLVTSFRCPSAKSESSNLFGKIETHRHRTAFVPNIVQHNIFNDYLRPVWISKRGSGYYRNSIQGFMLIRYLKLGSEVHGRV